MESTSKIQRWNSPLVNPVVKRIDNVRLAVVGGLILVVVLGGLAAMNPFISIVGSLAILLLAVLIPRPILIVYGLTLLLPLTGGLARGAAIPYLRVGQALLVVGCVFFMLARPGRLGKSRLTGIDLVFALFMLTEAVFPLLALYYRGEQLNLFSTSLVLGQSPLQVLLGPIQYYLLYRIVVATISSERQMEVLLKLIFVTSIIVSIIGILEKVIPSVRTLVETYYPPQSQSITVSDTELRVASTLQHFSGLGAYLTFTIILALACYTAREQLKISRLLLAATFLFDSLTLVLTGTLATWIGLAVGIAVIFLLIRRIPRVIIFVLIGIGSAALIFQSFLSSRLLFQFGAGYTQGGVPNSLAFRIMLWQDIFLPAIGQNLIFGAGPAPAVLNIWPAEESQYFFALLRGGLLYLFSYLLLFAVAIAACWRQIKSRDESVGRPVAIGLLAILIAISVMNFSAEYFTYVGGTQTIWTLLAIVVANSQLKAFGASAPVPSAVTRIMGRWRAAGISFRRSVSRAASMAVAGPVPESLLTRDIYFPGSYSVIPSYVAPETSRVDLSQQRLTWLRRLLDWRFVKDSVVVGVGSTIARVLGLLFSTVLAHFLVPDDFGYVRYVITLAGIITIAASNSPVSIARFLAAHPNDAQARDRYFTNGLVGFAIVLTASLLLAVPVLSLLHAFDIGTVSCIIGLAGFFCYLALARGLSSAWKMSLIYILNNVALILALIVVFDFFKIRTAIAATTIWGLANLAPLIMEFFKPMPFRFRPRLISKDVLLELARFSIPMVVSSGAFAIWFGLDLLLVQNFSSHESGVYAAAKTLAQVYIFVPTSITMVLMPRVAAHGFEKSKRYILGAILVALLVSLSGFVIVDVWGQKLIGLVFGYRYSDAYVPLLFLSIGMSILAVYTIVEGVIIGRGQPRLAAQALLVAMISSGVSGFWLTSWLGAIGASLTFTIGAAFGTAVMLFNSWHFLRMEKKRTSSNHSSSSNQAVATTSSSPATKSEDPSEGERHMSAKSVFIVWYSFSLRAESMAAELGARVSFQYEVQLKGLWLTPLRYLVQGWKTWRFLDQERPEIVLVQAPPVFAPLAVALWCWLRGKNPATGRRARYVVDSHTAAFHHHHWRWSRPLLRFLSRRAVVTLVTDEEALNMLLSWKARGLFLVNPIPTLSPPTGSIGSQGELRVAVISVFSDNEPIEEVFGAARLLPEVTFYLTGDPERAPAELLAQKPENVNLTGFLKGGDYTGLLENVHGVVVLTKEQNDLSCAAYEALVMEKPIVSSNGREMRRFYTQGVVFVNNTPESIAEGIEQMLKEQERLTEEVIAMRSILESKRQPKFELFLALLKHAAF